MSEITLTQADNGRTIDIWVGDRLDVNLRENPTTGFQWGIDQNNDEVLRVEGAEYISPTTSPIGGAGQRTFTFIGQQSGTAELRLKLWREWQGESSVVERFTVTIQVHD
ncbi:MAG: protease inhibitor I42 family protein [Synechococcales cyanobacterium T60_A2020_003]|nr:protease inhibitor I42 family protein [Synechococcales cyanobacterium T60_A2020_003]